jgi:hypothetical protein
MYLLAALTPSQVLYLGPLSGPLSILEIAGAHRPALLSYITFARLPKSCSSPLLFFFLLTLVGYTWIKKQGYQSDKPPLHIGVAGHSELSFGVPIPRLHLPIPPQSRY